MGANGFDQVARALFLDIGSPPATMAADMFPRSIWLALALAVGTGGCSTRSVGHLAVKTVETAGSLTGKVAVATVKTTGQVALVTGKAAISTSGQVANGLATTAFVTFKDTATGISRQVPYTEGLRLYAATQTAKLDAGLKAFELLRDGASLLRANWSSVKAGTKTDPVLKPGDVIQVSHAGAGVANAPRHS